MTTEKATMTQHRIMENNSSKGTETEYSLLLHARAMHGCTYRELKQQSDHKKMWPHVCQQTHDYIPTKAEASFRYASSLLRLGRSIEEIPCFSLS